MVELRSASILGVLVLSERRRRGQMSEEGAETCCEGEREESSWLACLYLMEIIPLITENENKMTGKRIECRQTDKEVKRN